MNWEWWIVNEGTERICSLLGCLFAPGFASRSGLETRVTFKNLPFNLITPVDKE